MANVAKGSSFLSENLLTGSQELVLPDEPRRASRIGEISYCHGRTVDMGETIDLLDLLG